MRCIPTRNHGFIDLGLNEAQSQWNKMRTVAIARPWPERGRWVALP